MVAAFFGYHTTLTSLRARFSISARGATLAQLIHIAKALGLAARPLRMEVEGLQHVRLPCILHWQHAHFVVAKSVGRNSLRIHDPAYGDAEIPLEQVSQMFTGIALELWPHGGFTKQQFGPAISIRQLAGRVTGLASALWRVLLLALVLEVLVVLAPILMQLIIDEAVVGADLDLLTTLGIASVLLIVMQVTVRAARMWAAVYMGTSFNLQWRANVFSHLLRLPVSYFEKRHLGDVASRFASVDQIQQTVTTAFVESVLDGLFVVLTVAVMFAYSASMTFVALAASATYLIVRVLTYRALYVASQREVYFQARQQSLFLESARGIKALKLFSREEVRRVSWISALVDYFNAGVRVKKLELITEIAKGFLSNGAKLAILWMGAYSVISGSFTLGALVALLAYASQFDERSIKLMDNILKIRILRVHAERLADILLTEPEPEFEPEVRGATRTGPPSIEVRDLSFRFSDDEPYLFRGMNFRVEPGESVALVGPSGSGKTTLVNLIMGVLRPSEGAIFINDVDSRQLGIGKLRSMVGVVMQDDMLFAGSIMENIAFFDPDVDIARVTECARLAAIEQDISAMPMGFHSYIGDMGAALSGGQKQRILLARALYRRPSILILDEATSHLDVEREKQVNETIRSLALTRIIVAHRPETIASADRRIQLASFGIMSNQTASTV